MDIMCPRQNYALNFTSDNLQSVSWGDFRKFLAFYVDLLFVLYVNIEHHFICVVLSIFFIERILVKYLVSGILSKGRAIKRPLPILPSEISKNPPMRIYVLNLAFLKF